MQNLFLLILATLILFTQIVVNRDSPANTGGPRILYWVTDANPARIEQVKLFRKWLAANHYPDIDLRLDYANTGMQKTVIQGVTGVAGDLIDVYEGYSTLISDIGLTGDFSQTFARLGKKPFATYEGLRPMLTMGDRVLAVPANVSTSVVWINRRMMADLNLPLPRQDWTFDEFLELGRTFAERTRGKRIAGLPVFFINNLAASYLARTRGIPYYNESMSGPWPDVKAHAQVLKTVHDITYVDRLMPTAADRQSMATDQGYGGVDIQLFHRGHYAMFVGGRHSVIQFRKMAPMDFAAARVPHMGFPITHLSTRAVMVYVGGANRDLAAYFLAFLQSEEYNQHIVDDGDGLPGNPAMTETPGFLKPEKHPEEWPIHQAFAQAVKADTFCWEVSPFRPNNLSSLKIKADQAYMAGVGTAEGAAQDIHDGLQEIMVSYAHRTHARTEAFEKARETQKKIDAMKARGEKIPASLIANPFLRMIHLKTGAAFEDRRGN